MMAMARACLLVLLLNSGGAAATASDEFTALHRFGRNQLADGNITEALADLSAALAADPASIGGLWELGVALYYADRFEDAAAHFAGMHAATPNAEAVIWHHACRKRLAPKPRPAALALGTAGSDALLDLALEAYTATSEDRQLSVLEGLEDLTHDGNAVNLKNYADKGGTKRRYYAHLYLALYFDGEDLKRSRWEAKMATRTRYAQDSRNDTHGSFTYDAAGRISDTHAILRRADWTHRCPCEDTKSFVDQGGKPCSANEGFDCVWERNHANPDWAEAYSRVIDFCPRTCGLCHYAENAECPEENDEIMAQVKYMKRYEERTKAKRDAHRERLNRATDFIKENVPRETLEDLTRAAGEKHKKTTADARGRAPADEL